ncbi:hypothetical protein [Streptomyces sp. NPDC057690]
MTRRLPPSAGADGDEQHAIGLVHDLAKGRKAPEEARTEFAERRPRHV